MSYAELVCQSAFSFQQGASQPGELVARAQALGYPALALTDEASLAGVVRAWQAAREGGLKLIVGSRLRVQNGPQLVLLVPDRAAYSGLSGLITRARRRSAKGDYRLLADDLPQARECLAIWLPEDGEPAAAGEGLRAVFGERLWIGHRARCDGRDGERLAAREALARQLDRPLLACGEVLYHARGRRALHDVLSSLRLGRPLQDCGLALEANGERHLRSLESLRRLYPPALLAETLRVAEHCRFRLEELRYTYPQELVPAGETPASWLRRLSLEGAARRWPQGIPAAQRQQIEHELQLITAMGWEAFFLTVEDIVRWARARGILCQGRGSAANSTVCYALGITEVDPARAHLLFERFLSRERAEAPDIDVDFEHQRREEVIQYVYAKYGRERAALAATVIHYRPKLALRDVGRALAIEPDLVEAVSRRLSWWDRPETLPERMRAAGLDPQDPRLARWLRLARELLDFPRHLSQHVGGFIIADRAVSDLVPVENAAMPERSIIQWDKDDLEALGLLKVDILALGMLSAIRRTLELVSRWQGRPMGLADIPADCPATFAMIRRAETLGVFQIESRAQQAMLPRLQPECFYDLVIQVAIVRPGPIQGGMVHPYLRARQNPQSAVVPPGLESALQRTLGVPIFQEQVMQIAVLAAGFSAGEADQVRRSMAAWKRNGGLEKFRERLLSGMAARGYDPAFGERIYQMVLGFGSYGFPESHAASFALLAWASCWLKCHHPAAFIAALLNSQPMGFYPPSMLVGEARRVGVEVRPVEVQASLVDCSLEPGPGGAPALRLGFNQINGLTAAAAARIEAARLAEGPFRSTTDLLRRAALDRRDLDALARADALHSLAGHRRQARWQALGPGRLEGLLAGSEAREAAVALPAPEEGEEIVADYQSTGLTLRRHPLALLRPRLAQLGVVPCAALATRAARQRTRVAGLVMFRQRPASAKGILFMTLEDESGIVNLIVRPALLEAQRELVVGAQCLAVEGELQRQDGVTHLIAGRFKSLDAELGALPGLSRDFR